MSKFKAVDPEARSHAGAFADFSVKWFNSGDWVFPDKRGVLINNKPGWYVTLVDQPREHAGPFITSQQAFGAAKDAIDLIISQRRG